MIEGKLRLTTVEGAGRQFVAQSGTGHALVMDDADGHSAPSRSNSRFWHWEAAQPST